MRRIIDLGLMLIHINLLLLLRLEMWDLRFMVLFRKDRDRDSYSNLSSCSRNNYRQFSSLNSSSYTSKDKSSRDLFRLWIRTMESRMIRRMDMIMIM